MIYTSRTVTSLEITKFVVSVSSTSPAYRMWGYLLPTVLCFEYLNKILNQQWKLHFTSIYLLEFANAHSHFFFI